MWLRGRQKQKKTEKQCPGADARRLRRQGISWTGQKKKRSLRYPAIPHARGPIKAWGDVHSADTIVDDT